LDRTRSELSSNVKVLSSEIETLKREKDKLGNDIQIQSTRIRELKLTIKKSEEQESVLDRDTSELEKKKVKLIAEVVGKEESLNRINEIGFSDEDLLRVKGFLARLSKDENNDLATVKEAFFSTLALYMDIDGLEQKKEAEAKEIRDIVQEKAILSGEIKELEKRKGTLLGEMAKAITSISERVKMTGEEATSQIQRQVSSIREQFDNLIADAVKTGHVVGEMGRMVKEGKKSEKDLKMFIKEASDRFGVKNE